MNYEASFQFVKRIPLINNTFFEKEKLSRSFSFTSSGVSVKCSAFGFQNEALMKEIKCHTVFQLFKVW